MTVRCFERLADDLTVSAREEAIKRTEKIGGHTPIEAGWGLVSVWWQWLPTDDSEAHAVAVAACCGGWRPVRIAPAGRCGGVA